MEKWEEKLIDNYGAATVNKKLVLENEIHGVPRYVSEYVVGVYGEDGISNESIEEATDFIHAHQYNGQQIGVLKHKLTDEYLVKVLDKFKIEFDVRKNEAKVIMGNSQIPNTLANPSLAKEHPRLVIDGIWGLGELRYYPPGTYINPDTDIAYKEGIIELQRFKPLQLADISFDNYKEGRYKFDTDSWINLLISTIGLNYKNYNFRQKLILLSRMIPMVEDSCFMMEFGPPGTGKTYCYDNISAHSRVISGSSITAAQLFYNLSRRAAGLLLQYDVVLFDEVDKVKEKGIEEEVVNKLYKYLESFSFDRGGVEQSSTCGIMMVGNIKPEVSFHEERLFEDVLHNKLKEEAFITRLAGLIPGWELSSVKQRDVSITKNYGLMADYFSEILHVLREEAFQPLITQRIELKNANIRDEKSILRMISGLLKLIYPHKEIDNETFSLIADFAVEMRQKVINQLYYLTNKSDYNVELEWRFLDD